jgi:hypothetical protein
MQGALRAAAESGLGGSPPTEVSALKGSANTDMERGARLLQQASEGAPMSEGTPAVSHSLLLFLPVSQACASFSCYLSRHGSVALGG